MESLTEIVNNEYISLAIVSIIMMAFGYLVIKKCSAPELKQILKDLDERDSKI